jgi:hypothetical protein
LWRRIASLALKPKISEHCHKLFGSQSFALEPQGFYPICILCPQGDQSPITGHSIHKPFLSQADPKVTLCASAYVTMKTVPVDDTEEQCNLCWDVLNDGDSNVILESSKPIFGFKDGNIILESSKLNFHFNDTNVILKSSKPIF